MFLHPFPYQRIVFWFSVFHYYTQCSNEHFSAQNTFLLNYFYRINSQKWVTYTVGPHVRLCLLTPLIMLIRQGEINLLNKMCHLPYKAILHLYIQSFCIQTIEFELFILFLITLGKVGIAEIHAILNQKYCSISVLSSYSMVLYFQDYNWYMILSPVRNRNGRMALH